MEKAHVFTSKDVKTYLETLGIEWDGENSTYNKNPSETINQIKYNYTLKVDITKPLLYNQGKANICIYLTDASFIINVYESYFDILGKDSTLRYLADATSGWIEYLVARYPEQTNYFKYKLNEEKQTEIDRINNKDNVYHDKELTTKLMMKNVKEKYTNLEKIIDNFENQNAR